MVRCLAFATPHAQYLTETAPYRFHIVQTKYALPFGTTLLFVRRNRSVSGWASARERERERSSKRFNIQLQANAQIKQKEKTFCWASRFCKGEGIARCCMCVANEHRTEFCQVNMMYYSLFDRKISRVPENQWRGAATTFCSFCSCSGIVFKLAWARSLHKQWYSSRKFRQLVDLFGNGFLYISFQDQSELYHFGWEAFFGNQNEINFQAKVFKVSSLFNEMHQMWKSQRAQLNGPNFITHFQLQRLWFVIIVRSCAHVSKWCHLKLYVDFMSSTDSIFLRFLLAVLFKCQLSATHYFAIWHLSIWKLLHSFLPSYCWCVQKTGKIDEKRNEMRKNAIKLALNVRCKCV